MKALKFLTIIGFIIIALSSCAEKPVPKLIFKFQFDSTQVRLNNIGQPDTMEANHRGQSPNFNLMSAHYIELAPVATTALGTGEILFLAPQTTTPAIIFDQNVKVGNNQEFFSMPIKDVAPGTYDWLRISLAYQNYNINYRIGPPAYPTTLDGVGTIASFIGYKTNITTYTINTQQVVVNADKLQGYWGFETFGTVTTGQAPPGSTTVPNPLFASSPIPAGSCVVTAAFSSPLVITGSETQDVVVIVSLSINKSFEWIETGGNNLYEPLNGDTVIDMGVRGMIPIIQ